MPTAIAPANIAFIKYWGKKDPALNLPFHNNISMNLDTALTTTSVELTDTDHDTISLNGEVLDDKAAKALVAHLDRVRQLAGRSEHVRVETNNSFPTATGIASSASGFAALSLAATAAFGLNLSEHELSCLARLGSGSACRSIPTGYAEWEAGNSHETSFATSIAPPEHWQLFDIIVIAQSGRKEFSSGDGHSLAPTSSLFAERLSGVGARLAQVRQALAERDLEKLGTAIEAEAISMHSTTFTATEPLTYWNGTTIEIIRELFSLRRQGEFGYFTIDAGANVHVITDATNCPLLEKTLSQVPGVESLLVSGVGSGARLAA